MHGSATSHVTVDATDEAVRFSPVLLQMLSWRQQYTDGCVRAAACSALTIHQANGCRSCSCTRCADARQDNKQLTSTTPAYKLRQQHLSHLSECVLLPPEQNCHTAEASKATTLRMLPSAAVPAGRGRYRQQLLLLQLLHWLAAAAAATAACSSCSVSRVSRISASWFTSSDGNRCARMPRMSFLSFVPESMFTLSCWRYMQKVGVTFTCSRIIILRVSGVSSPYSSQHTTSGKR
eukprot:GHRQ01001127.1.p1 GENE.GHRQ01001127.1~~GHRQ01001127.1.p1  ORF type:complete len:235 (-),score=41.53 GHRQ01001127.1:504-1208(-)